MNLVTELSQAYFNKSKVYARNGWGRDMNAVTYKKTRISDFPKIKALQANPLLVLPSSGRMWIFF